MLPATPAGAERVAGPDPARPFELDAAACLELVPPAISAQYVPVQLDLRVLLDGVDRAVAKDAVAAVRPACGPLTGRHLIYNHVPTVLGRTKS